MGEIRDSVGRKPTHIDAYTNVARGRWDQAGAYRLVRRTSSAFAPTRRPGTRPIDLQATILHQLGLEHTKLTFKFSGPRLTG